MVGKDALGWGPLPQYDKYAGASFRLAEVDPMCLVQVFKEKMTLDCEDILHNRESAHLAPVIKKLRDIEVPGLLLRLCVCVWLKSSITTTIATRRSLPMHVCAMSSEPFKRDTCVGRSL